MTAEQLQQMFARMDRYTEEQKRHMREDWIPSKDFPPRKSISQILDEYEERREKWNDTYVERFNESQGTNDYIICEDTSFVLISTRLLS